MWNPVCKVQILTRRIRIIFVKTSYKLRCLFYCIIKEKQERHRVMQDISEFLKFQMTKDHCSSFYAFLIAEGEDYESLQSAKQQMANAELHREQHNQLGTRNRGRKSVAINPKF